MTRTVIAFKQRASSRRDAPGLGWPDATSWLGTSTTLGIVATSVVAYLMYRG